MTIIVRIGTYVVAAGIGALVALVALDAYHARLSFVEDRVAALEAIAMEPRPLFVVAEGYRGHVFVNGQEVPE